MQKTCPTPSKRAQKARSVHTSEVHIYICIYTQSPGRIRQMDPPWGSITYTIGVSESRSWGFYLWILPGLWVRACGRGNNQVLGCQSLFFSVACGSCAKVPGAGMMQMLQIQLQMGFVQDSRPVISMPNSRAVAQRSPSS